MKVKITVKQIDSEYNQAYADEYQFGKESESNWKHHWSETFGPSSTVKEVIIKEQDTFLLKMTDNNGHVFSYNIPDMYIVECIIASGESVKFAFSNSLIQETFKPKNNRTKVSMYYFYLKDHIDYVRLAAGVMIAKKDFPKELELQEK